MSVRSNLAGIDGPMPTSHAGLWIDKFLSSQPMNGENGDAARGARGNHLRMAAGIRYPEGYEKAFERRLRLFDTTADLHWNDNDSVGAEDAAEDFTVVVAEAKSRGRLVVGLGEESVLEVGIHLDHTWGVPVIPGSALKGLAAAAARQLVEDESWRESGESYRCLFGSTDEQGEVAFLDAWWKPEKANFPLHLDVMTVHHAEYYQSKSAAPSDTDSPVPIPFLSTTGTFVLAVEGPGEWCDAALELLRIGLDKLGIGAKTNSGYGRMTLRWPTAEERREERRKRQEEALPLSQRLPKLHAERLAKPLQEQIQWLLGEGALPQYGATESEWKEALEATYAEAIARIRDDARGKDSAVAVAEAKLAEHRANKPRKGDRKSRRRWERTEQKLKGEVEKLRRTDANREKRAASYQRWLDWLDRNEEQG